MQKIAKIIGTACQASQAAHESAFNELESLYRSFRDKDKITIRNAISTIRFHNKIATTSPEFYVVVMGVFFILVTSGSFGMMGDNADFARYVFLATILALALVIPIGLTFIFMPLHILKSMPLALNTGAILAISSVLISLLAPAISEYFTGIVAPSPLMVFIPIGGVLALTGIVLHARNGARACFIRFNKCYPTSGLDSIIPVEKRGELHTMEAQDHYVLFITDKGQHMHRMTMKSALEVLPPESGIHVHRSHWVANSQIIDLVQEQQKLVVILRNGRQVPVGKTKVEAVRALL